MAGVAGTGVTLQVNGHSDVVVASDGSFKFADAFSSGAAYKVSIAAQPNNPVETCVVSNDSGTVGTANVNNVKVTCAANSYSVGGTISGLSGTLELSSPGIGATTLSSNGAFVLAAPVVSGGTYNVTVNSQPANQTCSLINGTGTVSNAAVTNITVTCSGNAHGVGGAVSGLVGSGLVLQNNGGDNLTVSSASTQFAFATPVNSGAAYSVTVLTQPSNPNQTCAVTNGSGTVGAADITNVGVTCTSNTYTLGGTVSGLNGTGLVLSNGSATLNIPANGAFAFGSAIASGSSYNVVVGTQPSSPAQTCIVTNASGTITSANVSNVVVSCANNDVTPPTVTTTNPLNTAVGAAPQLAVTATFSEALSSASVTVSSFTVTGPGGSVSGTVTLTGGNQASFTPSAPLEFNTTYQARLTTAIRDTSNNALAADKVWSFNTGHRLVLGGTHACVRYDSGQLKCWGANSKGQLGLGNTNSRGDASSEMGTALPPVNLGAGRVAVAVVGGVEHTCARLDNNQVKCWGSGQFGQTGLGGTASRGDNSGEMGDSLPAVQLGTNDVVLQLAAGGYFTCARLASGQVKCWGRNDQGQLGLGDTDSRGDAGAEMGNALAAINLGSGRTAIDISATKSHLCARLDDNTAKCWGENIYGQLGLGDINSRGDAPGEMGDSLPALDLGAGLSVEQIAVNSGHTCAVLNTHDVKCWGNNQYAQLGLGDVVFRGDHPGELGDALPTVDLGTGRTATYVVEGSRHTCALLDNSKVKCWGWNPSGPLGLGDTDTRGDAPGEMGDSLSTVDVGTGRTVLELAAGSFFTCARLDDDEIKCWGINDDGQLGLGDTSSRGDAPGEMGDSLPSVDLSL